MMMLQHIVHRDDDDDNGDDDELIKRACDEKHPNISFRELNTT